MDVSNPIQSWNKDNMGAPVEHSVERRNLVDTHGRHLEQLGDIVHDGNTRPALVLALAKVKQGNGRRFLVLRRVVRDDFLSALQVLRAELEGKLGLWLV